MPPSAPQYYVHPEGSDQNAGRSWATAKRTILAAYDAMLGGDLLIADNSPIGGEVANQGVWLTGDSSLLTAGSGWRPNKPVRFIGTGASVNQFGTPGARIAGGDSSKPAIWICGSFTPTYFENLVLQSHIEIGVGPNGQQAESTMTAVCRFIGVQEQHNFDGTLQSVRPAVRIGNAFWLWFDHCRFLPNAGITNSAAQALGVASGDDRRAAILIKPDADAGANAGLIHIDNLICGAGNLKFYGSPNGGGMVLHDAIFEADGSLQIGNPVHILRVNEYVQIEIRNVSGADNPDSRPDVLVEGAISPHRVIVEHVPRAAGPCTILGVASEFWQSQRTTPSGQGQVGFWQGRVAAQHDSARRLFAPSVVRFRNLAPQATALWPSLPKSGVEVTAGVPAPDGSRGAARLTSTGDAAGSLELYRTAVVPAAGSDVFVGCWTRKELRPDRTPESSDTALGIGTSDGSFGLFPSHPLRGDGEWEWVRAHGRLPTPRGATELVFTLRCDFRLVTDFFAPVLVVVPPGELSPSEAAEFALHLATWPDGVPPACVSTLRGQKLLAQGGIGVGNHKRVLSATRKPKLGPMVRKVEIFDEKGKSLGFIPVYKSIS